MQNAKHNPFDLNVCAVLPWLFSHRYGGVTVGNIQKSVPASFGRKIPPMVRKIAVRRSAQVGVTLYTEQVAEPPKSKPPLTERPLVCRSCTTTKATTACQHT